MRSLARAPASAHSLCHVRKRDIQKRESIHKTHKTQNTHAQPQDWWKYAVLNKLRMHLIHRTKNALFQAIAMRAFL